MEANVTTWRVPGCNAATYACLAGPGISIALPHTAGTSIHGCQPRRGCTAARRRYAATMARAETVRNSPGRRGSALRRLRCRSDSQCVGDARAAVIGADPRHVGHARHAVDLLERGRHGLTDDLGAGARVGGGDNQLRWRDIRKLRNRQQAVRDRPVKS
jgi:hypothetical protein